MLYVCVCLFLEGREAGRSAMVCMYVNKKGRYCVVNVIVRIEEFN